MRTVYLYDNELNGTVVDWKMPSDYLNLLLAPWSNAISSSYWSTHSLVSLLIDGVEIVNNQPAVNRVVNFLNIPSELLVPGKLITLKDENFSISYVIGTFELTLADPLANVLVGTSGHRYVLVEVCNGRCENMTVFPEYDPTSGKYIWMANFNGILDITNDSFGTISFSDYDGNTTQYHWRAFSSCYNFLPVISKTD